MSGGQLVVMDRLGRDVKRYPLPEGLATIGSDPACDIRVMLPVVSPHHATVVVHANQTVVRNVSSGETLVNGRPVSVAALRHGDVVSLGGRQLRWEYARPRQPRPLPLPDPPAPPAALLTGLGRAGGGRAGRRRASAAAAATAPDPALTLAIELQHRASMPGSTGGKQVAIVQPQRRDTNDQNDKSPTRQPPKRPRSNDPDGSLTDERDKSKRKTNTPRASPKVNLQNTTKATLWIESRKTSPRKSGKTPVQLAVTRRVGSAKKSTPLRMTVLRKVQSAQKMTVTKIEAPTKIDHTKRAAIMLMTGHTPKAKPPSPKRGKKSPKSPTFLVKKPSPARKTPNRGRKSTRRSSRAGAEAAPRPSAHAAARRHAHTTTTRRTAGATDHSITILEITDSDARTARTGSTTRASRSSSPLRSPLLPTPRKSAMKDPKRQSRKTESIKFDLSNLENHAEEHFESPRNSKNASRRSEESMSEDELTLHYSDTSATKSPSPRKSIHSRSSKILEKTLGTTVTESPKSNRTTERLTRTLTPDSPRGRKSSRGSIILQKALNTPDDEGNASRYSRRTTKTLSDQSWSTTVASAFKTRTLSPRSPGRNNMESYSIVDLVSIDSNDSNKSASVYNSAGSTSTSSIAFESPQNSTGRKTRSTIDGKILGSSTPYVGKTTRKSRSQSADNSRKSGSPRDASQTSTRSSVSTRRSKSLTTPENITPENTQRHISVNSTRISRTSKSKSRINDSDLLLISGDGNESENASPKSSKRMSRKSKGSPEILSTSRKIAINETPTNSPSHNEGTITPENRRSPQEVGTPVLSIQSLLDSSQSSFSSQTSQKKRVSLNVKRKTIAGITRSEPRRGRLGAKSKSLNFASSSLRSRNDSSEASDKTDDGAPRPDNEEIVTPKSAVKLVQEAVKNKHSTAKKPLSKRSIIDTLNESDIVKQLFNSPVKRKLSQSMTEFSRKQLFDDDEIAPRKRTRNTIALTGRTPNNSILDQTQAYDPEVFVSPISTPSNSPNLAGIKRLFGKNTPENDLRNVKGVKGLLRTPRTRKSVRNDLTDVAGVKAVFAKSPRNRLSDVRVKKVFAGLPKNDLRRVSGVKSLFQAQNQPKNDLSDVRGVRSLFKRKSPKNDLRNVSGVKKGLQSRSPKNDLRDVRGVKQMFRQEKDNNDLNDVSGIEELFNESNLSNANASNTDSLFDQLIGKPPLRSYKKAKSFAAKTTQKAKKSRAAKSLHNSIDIITNNVEEWLEQELKKRMHKDDAAEASTSKGRKSVNKSKSNVSRALQKLTTDTVEGSVPIRTSRTRNSSVVEPSGRKKSAADLYEAHTLPIKKRSLVEASLEKSIGELKAPKLPIKKRAVIHSTPMKGRANMTMNASELGRVSPIAAVDKTRNVDNDTSIRSVQEAKELPEPAPAKTKRATKSKSIVEEEIQTEIVPTKVSPKKTRASKAKVQTPPRSRATRGRQTKTETPDVSNTKRRRTSVVISKKSPVLNPKPAKTTRSKVQQESVETTQSNPKKPRATRRQKTEIEKPVTPKTTRAKVQKATVVVSKPSPNLKPKAVKRGKKVEEESLPEPLPQPTRKTRKTEVSPPVEEKPKRRKAEEGPEPQSKRLRKTVAEAEPKTRGRKTTEKSEDPPKRGRKTVAAVEVTENKPELPKKRRGKQIETQESQESTKTEPTRRGRGNKVVENTVQEPRGRKRKTASEENKEVSIKEVKTRGKKAEPEVKETRQQRSKGVQKQESKKAKGTKKQSKEEVKEVAQKKTEAPAAKTRKTAQKEEPKPTRGRRGAAVIENPPQSGGRKRKSSEISPAKKGKEAVKKQPAAKKARNTPASPANEPRSTSTSTRANKLQPEASAVATSTSRSRRR